MTISSLDNCWSIHPQDKLKKAKVPQIKKFTATAAEQAIRRLTKQNPKTGKRKVGEEVAKAFFAGGTSRKDLVRLFQKCGGDKDSWLDCFHILTDCSHMFLVNDILFNNFSIQN